MHQPLVCLLLNKGDEAGVRLFRSLQNEGVTTLKMISAEELVYASRVNAGVKDGKAYFDIQLQNGLVLNNKNVKACLNRVSFLPLEHAERFQPEDRQYVSQELTAIFTFLFSCMPNQLFNSATGMGLSGRSRGRLQWLELARLAGFETINFNFGRNSFNDLTSLPTPSDTAILYFNGKCYGPVLPVDLLLEDLCTQLGLLSEERVLEIYIRTINGRWAFVGANTLPAFNSVYANFLPDLKMLL